ncbi:MFS transporter [Cohnella pontilimi]|uniref:MFS transporter n=1 Tax=Cohnella pontilimi TaxID=2564100 RepID=A0A4U0F8A0_9BACL|nr:MFS transporter [Cohnella pontilimi]TJY40750.1 MFS transporter [Cohnella pontilimi]
MESSKKWDLASISTIPLTMTLANSMLIPVLPEIQKKLLISPFQASLIITVYAAVSIFFIPVAGYLSDRYGRKIVILPGLMIVAIAGGAAGWASVAMDKPYPVIIGARLLQGLGAAGCFPVVFPLVGDLFKREEDVSSGLGIVETSNTFGKVLSPILGSLLGLWAWYMPFWAIPVFSLLSFVMVAFLVKKPKVDDEREPLHPRQFLKSIGDLFRKRGRWLYGILVIGGISMFLLFGALFYLSESLEDRGMHGVTKGLVLAVPLAVLCTAAYLTGRWIGDSKVRMKWISTIGLAIATGALVVIAVAASQSTWWLIGMLAVCVLGLGAALPCLDALLTESIGKEQRGTVTSIYSSMRFIGVASGPPAGALLMKSSMETLFFVLAASCALACLLVLFTIRPK